MPHNAHFLVFDCECLICLDVNKLFSLFQIERFVVCKIVSKAAHPTYELPPELLSLGEDGKSN